MFSSFPIFCPIIYSFALVDYKGRERVGWLAKHSPTVVDEVVEWLRSGTEASTVGDTLDSVHTNQNPQNHKITPKTTYFTYLQQSSLLVFYLELKDIAKVRQEL